MLDGMNIITAGIASVVLGGSLAGGVAVYNAQADQDQPAWAPCPAGSYLEGDICVVELIQTVDAPVPSPAGPVPTPSPTSTSPATGGSSYHRDGHGSEYRHGYSDRYEHGKKSEHDDRYEYGKKSEHGDYRYGSGKSHSDSHYSSSGKHHS